MKKEESQEFFERLFDASCACITIEGMANCIKEVDIDSRCAKLYLNPALNALCQAFSMLSDELTELEERYHYECGTRYPAERRNGGDE